MGSLLRRANSQILRRTRKTSRRKIQKTPPHLKWSRAFECKGHGHVKKECPTYLKAKGKVFATTLSDLDSSNLDSEESCDGEGNYFAFMTIVPVDSSEDLNALVEELGEHTEVESMGVREEFDDEGEECVHEGTKGLQGTYNSLLEKTEEYVRVAKATIRKMKRAEIGRAHV